MKIAIVVLMTCGLAACGGPPVGVPAAQPAPASSVGRPVGTVDQPATANPAQGNADATRQTCEIFRHMVTGVDTLSTKDLQDLVDQITDVVQYTNNERLLRGVYDLGQGWLDKNPQQFAKGMRTLSAECHIPYQ
jgi:hypothetical protein